MTSLRRATDPRYASLVKDLSGLLESTRRASARTVNVLMTATYWEIERRIVEFEQGGKERAQYGAELLEKLSADLTHRFGRGFSRPNLQRFRDFYLHFPVDEKRSTVSSVSVPPATAGIRSTVSSKSAKSARGSSLADVAEAFPLPWSHYVRLLSVRNPLAREFYETEALRGDWSIRQLDRQIGSQFYERIALSRNKVKMLSGGARARPADGVSADEEIRDPLILEFLNLKDEYSERDLEEALILHLESFLLELGGDFTFVGRQKRLRVDDAWFRVDLVFFHRALRCFVIIDLKLDALAPGDIGQMHLYCNYARAHWARPGENPPIGLILCARQGEALARYALEGLPNKTLVREYHTVLPKEQFLADEITRSRRLLEARLAARGGPPRTRPGRSAGKTLSP